MKQSNPNIKRLFEAVVGLSHSSLVYIKMWFIMIMSVLLCILLMVSDMFQTQYVACPTPTCTILLRTLRSIKDYQVQMVRHFVIDLKPYQDFINKCTNDSRSICSNKEINKWVSLSNK